MRTANVDKPESLSLDVLAIHSFVKEMTDAVDGVVMACLSESQGRELWSQRYSNASPDPGDCIPASGARPAEPTKTTLSHHHAAYHFPLACKNISGLVFTLVVNSIDPPNLTSVSFGISTMLKCLVRQVDVDCTLTTTRLSVSPQKPAESFEKKLNALSPEHPIETGLQELAETCMNEFGLDGFAIALPDQKVRIVKTGHNLAADVANGLLAKLYAPLSQTRKIVSAKILLRDGSDGHVICAPILRNRRSVQGVVFIVSSTVDVSYSNVVRSIANRIATLPQNNTRSPKPLTRFELTSRIGDVLTQQPTLPHSLIYIDVDKMHTINDAFGYSGGDRALTIVHRIIDDSSGARDLVSHLGGDRFAMFLPGASGDTAVAKAEQVLRFLSQESLDDGDKAISLSASAGVVDSNAATKGAEDMLILSEVATRGAKDRGGNRCALFQDIDSSIIQRRSDVDKVGFLQMALIENKFVLHAQRIQALGGSGDQKYELLARLRTEGAPDRSPAEFLSAAERYQLMAALDRWVINSALDTIASAENPLEVSLTTFSINVSAQSLQDDAFVEFIESRIAETGVAPDTLCFELTETSLVRNIDRAQRFVDRLQRLGCQVALDDFGTGYSSFAYLKALPVNYLKVDGAFVRDILENDLSKAIVSSVVAIASVIGAQTVAEHVENPMVEAWLRNAGVQFVQGFSIHKPEPLTDVLSAMGTGVDIFDSPSCIDLRRLGDDAAKVG